LPSEIALAYLMAEYNGSLLAMSRSRRQVPGIEAEDLRQEAALALLQFNKTEVNEAYLGKTASGVMMSIARRAYRNAAGDVPIDAKAVRGLEAPESASAGVDAKRSARLIKSLMRALPKDLRVIVKMLYVQHLRPTAVAEKLGIEVYQVSKRKATALAIMAARLSRAGVTSLDQIL
jgi:RNA polymerase sigma factor (sigma-70 family)